MAKQGDEQGDALEIISMGKLYHGPWEKKYWSSSRGKDRHPYPVGYRAVRTYTGINYQMEILEGLRGPEFVIRSTDGQSCSGQTPDIAWQGFQKKQCVRVKFPRGKRFSCKMDAVELFGFKNPFVRRLMRELVANAGVAAEQSSPSAFFGNGRAEEAQQHHVQCTVYCIEACKYPELHLGLSKTQVKRKRSREHKDIHVKSISEATHKREWPQDPTQTDDGPQVKQSCQWNHNEKIPSTSYVSNEINADLDTVVGGNKLNHSSAEDGLYFDFSNIHQHLEKETCDVIQEASDFIVPKILYPLKKLSTCSETKTLSTFTDTRGFSCLKQAEEEGDTPVPKDSQMSNDDDLYAPDTLDLNLDSTYSAEVEISKESTCTVNKGLDTSQILISEDSITDLPAQDQKVVDAANQHSQKTDFDPVGQEIANSMMTVLLPQAVPLLKTFSRKKKTSLKRIKTPLYERRSQEEKKGTNLSLDVAIPELAAESSPGKVQLEKQNGEAHVLAKDFSENLQVDKHKEDVHIPSTDMDTLVTSLDDLVAADSFENDQRETRKNTRVLQFQDAAEVDRNTLGNHSCMHDGLHPYDHCLKNQELCDTAISKPSVCQDVYQDLEKEPQRDSNLMTDVSLGITSSSRKDACIHSDEVTSLHEIYPEQQNAYISPYRTKGTTDTLNTESSNAEGINHVSPKRISHMIGGGHKGSMSLVSFPQFSNSTSPWNTPHSESIECRDSMNHLAPKTCSALKHLPASDNCLENSSDKPVKGDPLDDVRRPDSKHLPVLHNSQESYSDRQVTRDLLVDVKIPDEQPDNLQMERSPTECHGASCSMAAVASDQDHLWNQKYRNTWDIFGSSTTCGRKSKASGCNKLFGIQSHYGLAGSISSSHGQQASYHAMTMNEAKDESSFTAKETRHSGELMNMFKLVGCYVHPMPITMVLLRTKGSEIYICLLCGYAMEQDRTLFIYKASIEGENRGCPSFIGHTTMISPFSRDVFGREVSLDSSCLQLTPDGKYLVLLNSIKTPSCREENLNCSCSVCASECFEKNAVKVVQVQLGYVQVLTKLKTTDDICCILVCEPNYLVAAEESGILHLWTMNSTWSAKTEESYLPTSAIMPDYIIEMKKIPNFAALVVGHNAFGDFCLWDLSRRILVSTFSAQKTSFCKFLPINLFRCPSQGFVGTGACRNEQVEHIMEEAKTWSNRTGINQASLPVEEDVSIVLLISHFLNLDLQNGYPLNDSGVNPVGCWNLALLAKSKLILGNALDASAAVVGASAGYGVVATCDGFLYIWELSTGSKLGYLSHREGAKVSCFAADDADSGAFAVVVDGSQLQVYSHSPGNMQPANQ